MMISEQNEDFVLKDEYLRDDFLRDDYIKGDFTQRDDCSGGYRDEYVIQTLNTAAPPSTLHVDEQLKNFDYRYTDSCGWHKFYPKKLQRLNNPKWFLFFLIVFSLAQAMIINGFTNVGLSTLEKQFKLTSKQSAMIIAAKEISSLTLIAVLSFYGSFGDKPKYLGVGAITTAVGSLLYVLPHAMVGNYIPENAGNLMLGEEVCQHRSLNETISEARCSLLGSSEWYYLFVFIIAKLLIGAGTAPLFTLGAAYIDENVKPKVSPGYLGVWYVSTSFGPGIGFVAGGSLLNVYVDLIQVCVSTSALTFA
jgi:organic anion transporter 4A